MRSITRTKKSGAAFSTARSKQTQGVAQSLHSALAKVSELQRAMDADQVEIDRLRVSTQENLAKTKAILDTF